MGVPLYWGTSLKYHYSVYYFAQEVGKNWVALGGYAVLVFAALLLALRKE